MRHRLGVTGWVVAAVLLGWPVGTVRALSIPPPPAVRVADEAAILAPADRERIEARLAAWETESSNQLVVAIFPSLDGEDAADFSNRLFEAWRIGRGDRNNGVLLAVFLRDRKVRIEVGYGLEARLTDALSRRIIDQEIAPRFRAGKYAEGVEAACDAIQRATRGEYSGKARGRGGIPAWIVLVLIVVILALALVISPPSSGTTLSAGGGRRSRRFGGVRWGRGLPWGGSMGGGGFGGRSSGGFSGGGFSGGGGLSGGGGATGSW